MTATLAPSRPNSGRTWSRALRLALRLALGLAAAALAVWAVSGHRGELEGAGAALADANPLWLAVAVGAEVAALWSFAAMQHRLLAAGGVNIGMGPLTAISLAGNAIQNSFPGGAAWASVFAFRQFRRRGADDVLAGWIVVAVSGLSAAALALVAAVGLILGGSQGSDLDLVGAIVTVTIALAGAVGLARLAGRRSRVIRLATRLVKVAQRLIHRPGGDAKTLVEQTWRRFDAVRPSRGTWAVAFGWAVANWLADSAALAAAFLAVGSPVPWQGLLLAYGAAQLAANLPITPGGLGVVEGSLTIALVAYGGATTATVAAVLAYRIVSFWALVATGWPTWAVLKYGPHRRSGQPSNRGVEVST